MTSQEKAKQRVHWLVQELKKGDFEGYENRLTELVLDYEERLEHISANTPRNTDIAALIQEMRAGFEAMDRRFAAVDKRFDDLIHQMDKRFEQVDKRFSFMQWLFGILLTFISAILTYGTFFQ